MVAGTLGGPRRVAPDVRLCVESDRVLGHCDRAGGRPREIGHGVQAGGSRTFAWAKNDFPNVYSSPILIDVDGLEQLAILLDGAVIGVNPHNGDLQWRVPFQAGYGIAVATPVGDRATCCVLSAESDEGTKVIQLPSATGCRPAPNRIVDVQPAAASPR